MFEVQKRRFSGGPVRSATFLGPRGDAVGRPFDNGEEGGLPAPYISPAMTRSIKALGPQGSRRSAHRRGYAIYPQRADPLTMRRKLLIFAPRIRISIGPPKHSSQEKLPGRKHRTEGLPSRYIGQTIARPTRFGSLITASSGTSIHSPCSRTR